MKFSRYCLGLSTALFAAGLLLSGSVASAAKTQVEGTPVPTAPKPDFSRAQYLIGTWTCSDLSSRRPGPFTTTQVYSMDPTGYWLLRDDTIHKASWIPRDFHSQTRITYDARAKKLVRITYGDQGGYSLATAPMTAGNQLTYTFVSQTKAADVSSYAPEIFTKVSDTKKTLTTSFTENNGRVVTVKETCTKS
jgi:hypothetical protein